jgi:excisionase family DNA binding protein
VKAAAAYVGVSVRDLWRRVERGELAVVRWPGCRRVVFDRQDLDGLFSIAFKGPR